jgi:4-diphosphocytidyl-2-C-methyl-D-erythritol kinase
VIVQIKAPAKINLHLDVLDRQDNGYHPIVSIFQSIGLCDTISIRKGKAGRGCILNGEFPVPREENIIIKAVRSFEKVYGKSLDLDIEGTKSIPAGAGLGGGSSDAAATVACLHTLFPGVVTQAQIKRILEILGSDVPFFYSAAAALVTGRGEHIEPLEPRTDYSLVVVFPGFQIHTGKAYQWLDTDRERRKIKKTLSKEELLARYINDKNEKWGFSNSFLHVIMQRHPDIMTIISDIYSSGAYYGNISGSGSAIFGLYRDKKQAEAGFGYLKKKYPYVFCTNPLDKRPLPVLK